MTVVQADELADTGQQAIEHYGIKGMKWGVRRKRGPDGKVSDSGQKSGAEKKSGEKSGSDAPKGSGSSSGGKRPKASDLSDKELQAAVNRMNLEASYNRMTKSDISRGEKFVEEAKKMAADVARQQIRNTANAIVAKEIERRFHIKTPKPKDDDD